MLWWIVAASLIYGLFKLIGEVRQAIAEPDSDHDFDTQMAEDCDDGALIEGWVPYAEHLAVIDRPDIPALGKWARFEYLDADGVVSMRNVTMWEKRGRYIVGFDRSRREERTFRQDRINDWICG